MTATPSNKFQRVICFDSDQGDVVTVDFTDDTKWKLSVDHIRFSLPNGQTWSGFSGFLKVSVETSGFQQNLLVTNGPNKIRGSALPIAFPDDASKMRTIGCLKGFSNRGPTNMTLSLLGPDVKTVNYEKLYVVMTIVDDSV